MDAVEFLEEAKRYCKWCENTAEDGKKRLCEACYFEKLNGIFNLPPMAYRKFVETVEEWSKENPVKTRQSEFLKMFPNARIESDGMPSICPIVVDKRCHNKDADALFCLERDEEECRKCRLDYWLQEVE